MQIPIFLMLFALLLGEPGQAPKQQAEISLKHYASFQAPLYISANLSKLRKAIGNRSELFSALSGEKDLELSQQRTLQAISKELSIDRKIVRNVFFGKNGIKRAAFWLFGFGDRSYNAHFLLLLDRGDAAVDILPQLFAYASRDGYCAIPYAGVTMYCFVDRWAQGVWLAEHNGKIAISIDPLAIKNFILRAHELENSPPLLKSEEPLLQVKSTGRALWSNFSTLLECYEREEFFDISCFCDFPALKELTFRYDGKHIEAALEIDEYSDLLDILAASQHSPHLLSYITANTDFAVVFSIKDAMKLWQHIERQMCQVAVLEGDLQLKTGLKREVRNELGIDIKKDIFANICEFGYFVPVLGDERDFQQNFILLFEVKNVAAARYSIEKLTNYIAYGKKVETGTWQGISTWKTSSGQIALCNNTVFVMSPNLSFPEVFQQLGQGKSEFSGTLRAKNPRARIFMVFNPKTLLPTSDFSPLIAAIYLDGNTLKLKANLDIGNVLDNTLKLICAHKGN